MDPYHRPGILAAVHNAQQIRAQQGAAGMAYNHGMGMGGGMGHGGMGMGGMGMGGMAAAGQPISNPYQGQCATSDLTKEMSYLQTAMPGASPEDIRMAAQQYPGNNDEALRQLVHLMMQRASKRPQAARLSQNGYYGHGPHAGVLAGLAGRLGARPPVPYNQFAASPQAQQHAQAVPVNPAMFAGQSVVPASGRRKALLFASNYVGTQNELGGCIDDQKRMKELLTTCCGFADRPEAMVCLNDGPENRRPGMDCYMPNRANIIKGMRWLVDGAVPGDVLCVHYSGHGGQQASKSNVEADGKDEVIYPLDFEKAGVITDDTLFDELISPLPEGIKLIVLLDCCHSGSALDLPFTCLNGSSWKQERVKKMPVADVVMLSGCRDDQTSADVGFDHNGSKISGGAMTLSFLAAYVQKPDGQSHRELIGAVNQTLKSKKMSQVAQLTSSQQFGLERIFDFEHPIPNMNH